MAISKEQLAGSVFDIVSGYGNSIKLYKDTGEAAYDAKNEASKFYIADLGTMVTIESGADGRYEIKVIINKEEDFERNKSILKSLRKLATSYNVLFNSRVFDKKVHPKDFAYQAHAENIKESLADDIMLSKASNQNITNGTKIVIKHQSTMDETTKKRNSVQKIFIEDSMGQRILFPSCNVQGAKAMARHIANDGSLFDDLGKYIVKISENYEKLKIVKKASKKLSETDQAILNDTNDSMSDYGRILRSLQTKQGYAKYSANLPTEPEINADLVKAVADEIMGRCAFSGDDKSPFELIAQIMVNKPKIDPHSGHVMESFHSWLDNEIVSSTRF